MSFEIKFTPEAEDTFDSLADQLRTKWGESSVEKLERQIIKSLKLLENDPYICPIVEAQTEVRRCILHKNCSLLYKITGQAIVVICF